MILENGTNGVKNMRESRRLKDPQAELDRLLAHFFVAARRKDATLYEPDTLSEKRRRLSHDL